MIPPHKSVHNHHYRENMAPFVLAPGNNPPTGWGVAPTTAEILQKLQYHRKFIYSFAFSTYASTILNNAHKFAQKGRKSESFSGQQLEKQKHW